MKLTDIHLAALVEWATFAPVPGQRATTTGAMAEPENVEADLPPAPALVHMRSFLPGHMPETFHGDRAL